jgi:hypothetical protein
MGRSANLYGRHVPGDTAKESCRTFDFSREIASIDDRFADRLSRRIASLSSIAGWRVLQSYTTLGYEVMKKRVMTLSIARFNACSICTMYKRVPVHCGHESAVLEIRDTERPDRTSVYFEFPISSGD